MRVVGGKFRGKAILSPVHKGTRPTSDRTREMIFNVLLHNPSFGPEVLTGKAVLDVFAGTGALGLEAISRGGGTVTFIENDKQTVTILKKNVHAFTLPASSVIEQDSINLPKATSSFDLIFLDPPYQQSLVLPALAILFSKGWISQKAVIVIEIAKKEAIVLPPFLSLITERSSGAAKVLFCATCY